MKKTIIILLALLVVGGTQRTLAQKIQKRYKSLSDFIWLDEKNHKRWIDIYASLVSVNLDVVKTPAKPRLIFDLSDKGQKQLIESLAARTTDVKGLTDALKEPVEKLDPPAAKELDKRSRVVSNEFKKTFNFYIKSVLAKEITSPRIVSVRNDVADRIENIKLLVTIDPSSKLKFLTWDKLKNQDTTINLGAITFSSGFEGSLTGNYGVKASLSTETTGKNTVSDADKDMIKDIMESSTSNSTENFSKAGTGFEGNAGVSATGKYTRNLTSNRQLMLKQNLFSGYFEPKRFFIDLSSFEGVQIVGSTFVTMTCKYEGDYAIAPFLKFENLSTAAGITPFGSIKYHVEYVSYPDVKEPVMATVNYSFLYRNVLRPSAKYFPEYKQRISYLYGSTMEEINAKPLYDKPVDLASFNKDVENSKSVESDGAITLTLIKENEFAPKRFEIRLGSSPLVFTEYATQPMIFESYKEAFDFLTWLRITALDPAGPGWINSKFTSGGTAVTAAMVNNNASVVEIR